MPPFSKRLLLASLTLCCSVLSNCNMGQEPPLAIKSQLTELSIQAENRSFPCSLSWELKVPTAYTLSPATGQNMARLNFKQVKHYFDDAHYYEVTLELKELPASGLLDIEREITLCCTDKDGVHSNSTLKLQAKLRCPQPQQLKELDSALDKTEGFQSQFTSLRSRWCDGQKYTTQLYWQLTSEKDIILPKWKQQAYARHTKGPKRDIDKEIYIDTDGDAPRTCSFEHLWYGNAAQGELKHNSPLPLKMATSIKLSDKLALDPEKEVSYTIENQTYSASYNNQMKGFFWTRKGLIMRGDGHPAMIQFLFFNQQGQESLSNLDTRLDEDRYSRFFAFPQELPSSFQVKYYSDLRTIQLPCSFNIPAPQWVKHAP